LIIMDDVGIDQMKSFGYGGIPGGTGADNLAPLMPNIDAVANAGVRFRNTWSMPECSPGRAVMFTGRFPLRSNILQAIGPADLNNSHVATWEVTTPKLLDQANYSSGMFGKFHLGGPENNQFRDGAPASVGWINFYGWTGGLPGAIDTTAGGVGHESGPLGTYSCGFVPQATVEGGADSGACYIPSETSVSCTELSGTNAEGDSVGLQCLTQRGVLVPNAPCQASPPPPVAKGFDELENGHYVSPLVINRNGKVEEAPLRDSRGRGFRATIEVDAAISWIKEHSASGNPWMATVSFSADHTPLQPPPGKLLSPATRELVREVVAQPHGCTTPGEKNTYVQLLSNALIEGMDTEFGRLLVETGIAHLNADGRAVTYNPQESNTVIVIVGDNGSLGSTVKLPFDAGRAKATAYQTGVWVPLIVSGPMVMDPGRDVNSMVNVADMFELFGEVAGIDVKRSVPRQIDSYPMLPYLINPTQKSLRHDNFAQGGFNIQANGTHNGPCVIPFPPGVAPPPQIPDSKGICSQVPINKSVCEDNYGIWWGGPDADPGEPTLPNFSGVAECWEVNQAIYKDNPADYAKTQVIQLPQVYSAVRNDKYKLVRNEALNYDVENDTSKPQDSIEFYEINEDKDPLTLELDSARRDLLTQSGDCSTLTGEQLQNCNELEQKLETILASAPPCPGDGNGDGVVNQRDILDWYQIATVWGQSSHYDFNYTGFTTYIDKEIIYQHWGPCPKPNSR
jgi:arylsulfatase A-like enzyme